MKAFNLTALSIGFALLSVFGICYISELVLGESAKYVVIVPALLIGMNARKIMEKLLGYTLLEAMKEGQDDEQKP